MSSKPSDESGAQKPTGTSGSLHDANRIIRSATDARPKATEAAPSTPAPTVPEEDPDIRELLPELSWQTTQWIMGILFMIACVWFFISVTHLTRSRPEDNDKISIPIAHQKGLTPSMVVRSGAPSDKLPPPPVIQFNDSRFPPAPPPATGAPRPEFDENHQPTHKAHPGKKGDFAV